MPETPQSVVHVVEKGGVRTVKRFCGQLEYLCRNGDIEIERSDRYLDEYGAPLLVPHSKLPQWAQSWLVQTGKYQPGPTDADSGDELTTHIVVSFPPGTDQLSAKKAARAWAWDVFGKGLGGPNTYDYITAFHIDRPHPHLHVIVNRTSFEGNTLKISHGNDHINWDSLREALVEPAKRFGIDLEATSREQRGIPGRSPTTEQYRQRVREGKIMRENRADEDRDFAPAPTPGSAAGSSGQGGSASGPGTNPGSAGGSSRSIDSSDVVRHVDEPGIEADRQRFSAADQQPVALPPGQRGSAGGAAGALPTVTNDQWHIEGVAERHFPATTGSAAASGQGGSAGGPVSGLPTVTNDQFRQGIHDNIEGVAERDFGSPATPGTVDPRLAGEADQERRDQIAEERSQRELAEWKREPDSHRDPSGPIGQKRRDDASWHRRTRADDNNTDREQAEWSREPDRRRTPHRAAEARAEDAPDVHMGDANDAAAGSAANQDVRGRNGRDRLEAGPSGRVMTKGKIIRAKREERRRRRHGDDLERVVETRAQKRDRLKAELEARSTAPPSTDPMELRDTPARQEQQARNQPGGAAGSSQAGGSAGGSLQDGAAVDNQSDNKTRPRNGRKRDRNTTR
jgi:type IV secretion system T-DNA border endonuclease VirD2